MPITTWVALGWPSMSRVPAPNPLLSIVIGGSGPKPDASAATQGGAGGGGELHAEVEAAGRGADGGEQLHHRRARGWAAARGPTRTMPVPVAIADA